jgi:hypothetical protein
MLQRSETVKVHVKVRGRSGVTAMDMIATEAMRRCVQTVTHLITTGKATSRSSLSSWDGSSGAGLHSMKA